MKEEKKLTAKQERFCQEYMVDFNATQAAIRSGYSEKTAQEIGSENLLKPIIKARLAELQAVTIKKLDIKKEDLILDLLRIKDMCLEDPKYINNSIKAIETINKMLGYNEAIKHEVQGTTINYITPLITNDDNQLPSHD